MEKEFEKNKKSKNMKKSAATKNLAEFSGQTILNYLTDNMNISETMIAAILEVTERSLQNWKSLSYEELSSTDGKSRRLVALYDFIFLALQNKIPKPALINLLQEPINQENQASNTPLFYIIDEPASLIFNDTKKLIIDNFLKSIND